MAARLGLSASRASPGKVPADTERVGVGQSQATINVVTHVFLAQVGGTLTTRTYTAWHLTALLPVPTLHVPSPFPQQDPPRSYAQSMVSPSTVQYSVSPSHCSRHSAMYRGRVGRQETDSGFLQDALSLERYRPRRWCSEPWEHRRRKLGQTFMGRFPVAGAHPSRRRRSSWDKDM